MFITYIQLVNFKRMPLRDDNTFEHTFNPTNKLTMISGPNGSGKSSLFNELTPLPSDKNDFNQGGYKEIHIEKDHDKYILISDFTEKSAKFRFVMNIYSHIVPSMPVNERLSFIKCYLFLNYYLTIM